MLRRARRMAALAAVALASMGQSAPVEKARPAISVWRLDCGALQDQDIGFYSDTMAFEGKHKSLTVSCYLVRHGNEYMLWDTGLPLRFLGKKPQPPYGETVRTPITDQLRTIGVDPARIGRVGISHYHFDHTGQLPAFAKATLLIGAADLAVIRGKGDAPGLERAPFAPWVRGNGKVQAVSGDLDVFGDGSVMMLDLPGHTPGHHGLLLRLPRTGPILISGDVTHFAENYAVDGVPTVNTDRAASLASIRRYRTIAKNLGATTIIEHEPGDVAKLAAFPKASD